MIETTALTLIWAIDMATTRIAADKIEAISKDILTEEIVRDNMTEVIPIENNMIEDLLIGAIITGIKDILIKEAVKTILTEDIKTETTRVGDNMIKDIRIGAAIKVTLRVSRTL